jgi:hypothetical protein
MAPISYELVSPEEAGVEPARLDVLLRRVRLKSSTVRCRRRKWPLQDPAGDGAVPADSTDTDRALLPPVSALPQFGHGGR